MAKDNGIVSPDILNQSILFARFANAAYRDKDAKNESGLDLVRREFRINEENSANKTDTQAFVCTWKNDVVIAFRGTENKLSDWWSDMNGALVPNTAGVGRIHKGFKAAGDSIYKYLVKRINEIRDCKDGTPPAPSRLFVCGHSLGGALALTIAARSVVDSTLPKIAGVFTYGAPRVGDEEYANAYRQSELGKRTHMWVAQNDPVARVAPFSFDYRHAMQNQYTLSDGAIGMTSLDGLQANQDEQKRFPIVQGAIGVFSRLKNAFQNLDAADHSISESYLKQLLMAKG